MNRTRLLSTLAVAVGVGLTLAGLLAPLGDTLARPASEAVPLTPTVCTISFSDVPPNHPFYPYILCLTCNGIVSGYADGTFHPNAEVTRGQLAKILAQAAGLPDPVPTTRQTFEDVP